ncbi:MAG: hypothetical protein V4724_21700 [Pseudomonadota bacterium]
MAIWQFAVGLIPREWAELEGNSSEMLYDGDGYNNMSMAWRQNQPTANLIALISQVLPPTKSWSDEMRIWGDQTKSDIQVSYEGNNVESVMACIDTRYDTVHICSEIVELARVLDCCFFLLATRSIIMVDAMVLSTAVHGSTAARFSAAPREFIEQLSPSSSSES